jgi:hypothetical protein
VPIAVIAMVNNISTIAKCSISSMVTDSYIYPKEEMKNLRFCMDSKSGKASKCHEIYVVNLCALIVPNHCMPMVRFKILKFTKV